jgi:dGTP triphosphohydrolase
MTKYVITNESKTIWVSRDKTSYTLTTDKAKALVFESETNANMVFKSNLSKLIKSKGVMVQMLEEVAPKPKETVTEQPKVTYDAGSSKFIISVISEAVAKLNCRHQELAEEQSKFDGQVTDIEHYIEFNAGKLNACSGYKAYKLLQDVLVQRRKVKDELQIIQVVRDRMNAEDIANIEQKIKELEARIYKPRELTYLFETKETTV